ncbi:MAG: Hsp20/alpha crystallin family protein [Gammaproteobacteria bacterium]|nr:Hsp20/alpha crystallin family protein [Gammaproteobacteria bacterium]
MNRLVTHMRETSPLARWGFFGDDLDRVFDGFIRPLHWVEEAVAEDLVPAMDIRERENEYVVRAELPGVKKEDVQITLENGVLTISAETESEKEEKEDGQILRRERRYGKYVRSLRMGAQVDGDRLKASYKDGVLELILPKAEAAKPRKITVDVN